MHLGSLRKSTVNAGNSPANPTCAVFAYLSTLFGFDRINGVKQQTYPENFLTLLISDSFGGLGLLSLPRWNCTLYSLSR